MDYQDRFERRLSAYFGRPQYIEIPTICSKLCNLSVQSVTFRPIYCTSGTSFNSSRTDCRSNLWNFIMSSSSNRLPWFQESKRMETTSGHFKQSILSSGPSWCHVRNCPEQGGSLLCVAPPRRESLSDRRPLDILRQSRLGLRISPCAHSPKNSGEPRSHR